MRNFIVEKDNWNFELIGDKDKLRPIFQFKDRELVYKYQIKKYVYQPVINYLFKKETEYGFIFGIGWVPYILYHFCHTFDKSSIDYLSSFIDPIKVDNDNLYDYQLEDANQLLKYKRGLFQTYTGYGKTELICHLINLFSEMGKRVLMMAPGNIPMSEIKNRYHKLYGYSAPYFDYESNINIININGFPRSYKFNKDHVYWESVDVILGDEAEYLINDTGVGIINACTNCSRIYGFSATADKLNAEPILLRSGNRPIVQRNRFLINYFGFSTVYKSPSKFNIDIINIMTTIFDDLDDDWSHLSEIPEESKSYMLAMMRMFSKDKFCRGLAKVAYREKGIFIPMESLLVIDNWIKNYFNKPDTIVVNVCGRGIELYLGGKFKTNINLSELKMMVADNMIDILVGTRSSYRAMDLPELTKVLPLTSKLAASVIQIIGRVARTESFQIYNLQPLKHIKVYTYNMNERMKLITSYYSNCRVVPINRMETYYGI